MRHSPTLRLLPRSSSVFFLGKLSVSSPPPRPAEWRHRDHCPFERLRQDFVDSLRVLGGVHQIQFLALSAVTNFVSCDECPAEAVTNFVTAFGPRIADLRPSFPSTRCPFFGDEPRSILFSGGFVDTPYSRCLRGIRSVAPRCTPGLSLYVSPVYPTGRLFRLLVPVRPRCP